MYAFIRKFHLPLEIPMAVTDAVSEILWHTPTPHILTYRWTPVLFTPRGTGFYDKPKIVARFG
jgi:hypothetical protein